MEAAVVNLAPPGERVLAVNAGKFGERWCELLRTYGCDVHELRLRWGEAVTPEQFHDEAERSGARIAFLTHSETSTGALCDLQQIGRVAHSLDVLLVVDAITSLGVHRLETQAWGIECLVAGSQKAFAMPPGLSFVALGPAARARLEGNPAPRYYFDLRRALQGLPEGRTPWTPAIGLVVGLERACQRLLAEGLETVWQRHQLLADAVRAGAAALGLQLVAARPSNALTAVFVPERVGAEALRATLARRFDLRVAGGQGPLAGRSLRLGHMGAYDAADVLQLLSALAEALRDHGLEVASGAALDAARPALAQLAALASRESP
jgi:aspartate aminotransferase-like enzyme